MKNMFKNRSIKFDIIYFSSLLLTTSIVCPLTSCGSDGTSNDIGGFDKEFGFDAQTYDRLERQFTSKYAASLLDQKDIDKDTYINKINNFLQNDLAILRNKLFDPAQNYSFTVRTNTLLDYASKEHNIQLNRNTNVSQIDFDNLKQSTLENLVIYMQNNGFDEKEIAEKKNKASIEFDTLLRKCISKYLDWAEVLMHLRIDVIDFWADLNDEFAYLSAYNHLKAFFDEYVFVVRENNNDEILWDSLLKNPDYMGENNTGKIDQEINWTIGEEQINNLFTVSKKSNESEKKEEENILKNDNSNESFSNEEPPRYKKNMIPGYILTPVLKTMSQDIYSNNYFLNIDWQLINEEKQNEDQKIIDKVTAHLATTKNGKVVDYYTDLKDGQLPSDSYQFSKYSLMASTGYQESILRKAYFDQTKEPDQKISFSWNKDKIGVEYFLPTDANKGNEFIIPDESYEVIMARDNLSLIGLQLNGTNLSDLLNKHNNSQDNQQANNANNDDNLKIEEKFVKYCDISAISVISFDDNLYNNNIQTKFSVSSVNTSQQCNINIESDLNNVGPSKNFINVALDSYKKVVNYIDSKKILDEAEKLRSLSIAIEIELYVACATIAIIFIWTLIRYKYLYFYNGEAVPGPYGGTDMARNDVRKNNACIYVIIILVVIMYVSWKYGVREPIDVEVNKISKWNDAITNRSKSSSDDKINVIDKVNGDDKDNFKSYDNFNNYYNLNKSEAFESYFYYFYFVDLLQSQNDSSSIVPDDHQVKIDYEQFNQEKIKLKIDNRIFGKIIIQIIVIFTILIPLVLVLYYYNIKFTYGIIHLRRLYFDDLIMDTSGGATSY